MADKFTVTTSENNPSFGDVLCETLIIAATLGTFRDPDFGKSDYKTEITDDNGNVISTGYGNDKGSSMDDAYTNL